MDTRIKFTALSRIETRARHDVFLEMHHQTYTDPTMRPIEIRNFGEHISYFLNPHRPGPLHTYQIILSPSHKESMPTGCAKSGLDWAMMGWISYP